jgi:hypothetical protein
VEAGLRVVKTELQKGILPHSGRRILPVRMYGLKPAGKANLPNRNTD